MGRNLCDSIPNLTSQDISHHSRTDQISLSILNPYLLPCPFGVASLIWKLINSRHCSRVCGLTLKMWNVETRDCSNVKIQGSRNLIQNPSWAVSAWNSKWREVKSPHGGSDFGGWRKEEWTLDMGRAKKRVINSSSLLLPTRRRRKRRDFSISPTASDPIRTEISLGGGPAELGVGKN